jgi:hypothetical protein
VVYSLLAVPLGELRGGDHDWRHFSGSNGDVLHACALKGWGLSSEALWDVAENLEA